MWARCVYVCVLRVTIFCLRRCFCVLSWLILVIGFLILIDQSSIWIKLGLIYFLGITIQINWSILTAHHYEIGVWYVGRRREGYQDLQNDSCVPVPWLSCDKLVENAGSMTLPLQQLLLLSFTPPFPSSVQMQTCVQDRSKYNGLEGSKTDCAPCNHNQSLEELLMKDTKAKKPINNILEIDNVKCIREERGHYFIASTDLIVRQASSASHQTVKDKNYRRHSSSHQSSQF